MQYLLFILGLFLSFSIHSQIYNPVPEDIKPSGLTYELEEVFAIPQTSNSAPKARINMLREAPDDSGRLFVIDLNGFLWQLDGDDRTLFINIRNYTNRFTNAPGKGTGFGAFAFHPDFAQNGKLYTSHTEIKGSGIADFTPPNPVEISMQWIITEWTMDNPTSATFTGTQQEILRVDYPSFLHGIQDIQFNPTATVNDSDYGNLYICMGDGGSSLNGQDNNIQNKSSYLGTILRINPLGNNSENGQYGIPADNPFVEEENALGEIFCYGFRNPHRISWDTEGTHLMLIADIGEKNIEEINIGKKGANYGWGEREGTFLYERENRNFVFELPENDSIFGYTYPIAQYDHDEGLAIVGGYVYRGNLFPELYGQYIFGDITSGDVFHVPVDSLQQGKLASISEVTFIDENQNQITLLGLGGRADLRFGIDKSGEIYFLTKSDGKIYRLKSDATTTVYSLSETTTLEVYPNPASQLLFLKSNVDDYEKFPYEIIDLQGKIIASGQISINEALRIHSLFPAIYFLKINIQDKLIVHQFIKK